MKWDKNKLIIKFEDVVSEKHIRDPIIQKDVDKLEPTETKVC